MASVELKNILNEQFNVQLPATVAFDYPTAAAVAGYILKNAGASGTVGSNIEGALEAYDPVYGENQINSSNSLSFNTYILGTGCLYPQSEKISDFWLFTEKSGTAQSEVPVQRWDVDDYYDPTISKIKLSYARFAAFVSSIDQFDSAAFRMGRADSTALDPQARILLQITGDALSGAQSLDPESTGTYVGCMFTDYMDYMRVRLQISHTGPMMTGNGAPYQSGRVAYSYGLQGPCIGIDTACSSSLVAAHAAHRGIIGGEAFAAIASGVNALLWHETTVAICQLQALSPVGRCKSFEASADGYGRGEGFVSLYLSSNSRGDAIGIILGGAVNQDGRSSSLTSPHGPSQQVLLAKSLRYCSLSPGYVENIAVHGTGTTLGDPIEVGAIKAVFNDSRQLPLALTSVKSCYGHTEGAAGATGLLFGLNFASNGALAPIMCLCNMNPYVASAVEFLPQLNFMPRQLSAGPSGAGNAAATRIASTSSFGMSGVNAHMIVQGAFTCPEPAVSTKVWKLQSYWPAPLQTGYIKNFTSRHLGAEAIMELNANNPSCAYLRDHTVAGRIIVPGTAVLSCIAIAARYLVGEETSPLACNTAFISPCNIGADSLQISLLLNTGTVFFVSGRSNRHASSRVAYASALAASLATNDLRANVCSVLLNNRAAGVKPPSTSVATLFTHSLNSACMFKGSIEPAESDATLHLSAIQTRTTLLPASVAVAGPRLASDWKMSDVKDKWTSVAFSLLKESTIALKSFTDARIISGGAMVPSSIFGIEARQAFVGTTLSSAASASNVTMLYSMDLESSFPLIVEPKREENRYFAASAEEETSSSGISLMLDTPPLGIGPILQVLQSQDIANFLRWKLNTSLQSHAAHGALKVATSEGILNSRHQVIVGGLACIAKGVPTNFTAAEIHSSVAYTLMLKPQYEQKSLRAKSVAKSHRGTLVTGALGGLGSLVSVWNALEKETQPLLLAGRTVHHDKLSFINDISVASQNSTITIAQANAACREDMSALISMQRIEAIYHTSGTLVDGSIQNQFLSGARNVFAPKVGALERLESNSSCMAVANVALFSSITSLLGTKGQVNYAAANAVLDAASSIWEEQGRSRCASIQWGAWSGSGMAASHPSLLKRLQVQGYGSVTPQAGLQAMQSILCSLEAPVVVANPFDWTVFLKHFKDYRQLLFGDKEQAADSAREITPVVPIQLVPTGDTKADTSQRSISKEFAADIILGLVRSIISNENISLDTPFFEAGLDSIGMVELSNAIVSTFKLEKLSSTVLFDYPSIIDLATHIKTLVDASSSAGSGEAERYLPSTSGQVTIPLKEVEVKLHAIMKDSVGLALEKNTTPFSEGGLDSITSVEFQKSVQENFHLEDFPITAVFDFPTIEMLAVEVSRRLEKQSGSLISSHRVFWDELSAAHETAFDKQVVLTGMASSFPTAQNQHESFMETALNGKDTTSTIPISKWDIDSKYAVEAGTANTSYCRFASLLPISTQVRFDCEIFRVTKNEATLMDPHARLLLAHILEAHNDCKANVGALRNETSTAVGVFVGCMWSNEYMQMLPQLGISQTTASAITGNTLPFLAGRVAYNFGWRGPCVPTDTACSSSLVAAHIGRLSLLANECQRAAVGGVNAHLSSSTTIKICALQALSPVGRCKSFDASADGYGRGEGFAVVMLEPARSTHSNNAGLAYLASTSVNTAGRSSGLTAPSGPAQRELVVDAIATAEITPNAVAMVAVHGTGTSLGDPIEIGALCQALELKTGERDQSGEALVVASGKSCFGHTEGAAGLTGALIAIGALQSQICPSIVNLRNINPYVASSLAQATAAMLPRQHAAASVYRNSGERHSKLAGK